MRVMVSSCVRVCPAILHNWRIFNVVIERHNFRNTSQLQTDVSLMICTCTCIALKCPLPSSKVSEVQVSTYYCDDISLHEVIPLTF
jgi:hypothetical protein